MSCAERNQLASATATVLHSAAANAERRVRRDGGDFDQFSGATVTPRAILARVQAVLAAYAEQGPQWFDEEADH
jgi:electron transport complex protein RnfG